MAYERRISDWSSDLCSSYLDRVELVFDQTDPREVARRRRAVDLAAVGRHHRLVGPGRRLCDEDSGGDEARTSEAAEMALDAREEHGAGRGAAHGDDRHTRSFPWSGVTIPKPISFSDSPEYFHSNRQEIGRSSVWVKGGQSGKNPV